MDRARGTGTGLLGDGLLGECMNIVTGCDGYIHQSICHGVVANAAHELNRGE